MTASKAIRENRRAIDFIIRTGTAGTPAKISPLRKPPTIPCGTGLALWDLAGISLELANVMRVMR